MSSHPSTIAAEPPHDDGAGWNDCATLHLRDGGGGLLHAMKRIRSGTLAELSGGRGTVVRSSDLDSLAGALRIADVESAPGPDDTLIAETTDLRLVGDVALRAGLPIWELKAKQADLEELFFSLTEGTNRNLGDATYPDSAAPTERDALAGQEGANL